MAGDKGHALRVVAVRQRNAGVGGRPRSGRDARHHLERNAGGGGYLQLFAAPAKDERVAALEAHHAFALLRQLHQQPVGLFLDHRVRAGALAHADALGVAAHQIEDLAADQMVIQHHVRLLHHLQPAQGQQPHVARPGAHQGYLTLRAFIACGEALQILLAAARLRRLAVGHQRGETAAEGFLPETATLADRGQPLFDLAAPAARHLRHLPQTGGQQRLQLSRSNRASTGAWPLDDTATTSGERSMIDGRINEQRGWSSTTLANTRRLSASANTAAFSALSSVAAIARNTSSSCGGSKVFPSQSSCPR